MADSMWREMKWRDLDWIDWVVFAGVVMLFAVLGLIALLWIGWDRLVAWGRNG